MGGETSPDLYTPLVHYYHHHCQPATLFPITHLSFPLISSPLLGALRHILALRAFFHLPPPGTPTAGRRVASNGPPDPK